MYFQVLLLRKIERETEGGKITRNRKQQAEGMKHWIIVAFVTV